MNSTQSIDSAPADDQLEVSLFGPGIGECVVVHLGRGEWMVVDSCLNDRQTGPVALDYLQSLGVDVAKQVRLVVITHWHDDHTRGAGRFFREAASARFVCPATLDNKEFFKILALAEQMRFVARDSSMSEIQEILEELHRRKERGKRSLAAPDHWAQDGMTLLRTTGTPSVSVLALSPSAQTVMDAANQFARLFPQFSAQIRRFPRCTPNDQSVALFIQSELVSVLLGADLETVSDPDRGWQAVVNSPIRPQVKGHVLKVSHHGSENGDHESIWSTLLEPDPPALLTTYASGKKPLPSEKDIQRLKSRTSRVYCTSWPPTRKPPKRHGAVDRTLREVTRMHRAAPRSVGHIRLRVDMARLNPPMIETFNGARLL